MYQYDEITEELDNYPLPEKNLDNIEQYEMTCIKNGVEGLKLNGRFVLSMIREIRALREVVKVVRETVARLDAIELQSRNIHDERWR